MVSPSFNSETNEALSITNSLICGSYVAHTRTSAEVLASRAETRIKLPVSAGGRSRSRLNYMRSPAENLTSPRQPAFTPSPLQHRWAPIPSTGNRRARKTTVSFYSSFCFSVSVGAAVYLCLLDGRECGLTTAWSVAGYVAGGWLFNID